MTRFTVYVDEETHRLARIRATELSTSLSALVRESLRALARERPDDGDGSGSGIPELAVYSDDEVRERVEQLYEEARLRAEEMTGLPVRNKAELVALRRRMLWEVVEDFHSRGIGIAVQDFLSREEIYDRDRARTEAQLVAAERRNADLEAENAALKAATAPADAVAIGKAS